nr:GNAT family N-acetyltransferase [Paenibacillus sp. EKM202P]
MWFVVDPAAQGQGYGRKLLNWVEHTIICDRFRSSYLCRFGSWRVRTARSSNYAVAGQRPFS